LLSLLQIDRIIELCIPSFTDSTCQLRW
jgi:hypothetical protein